MIDLAFEDKMTGKEVKSNVQQIMYTYGCNKRCSRPFKITLCDFHGETQKALENVSGFEAWSLQKDSRPYIEVFKKEELVYLTADSPHTIDSFDPSKVYVVGGIVDRNRYKGLTFDKATKQGIQTAKLPIGEFLELSSREVLTTNHVLAIMLNYNESGDWCDAFQKVIPMRKKWTVKKDRKDGVRDKTTNSFEKGGVYAKMDARSCEPPVSKKIKSANDKKSYGSSYEELEQMLDKSGGFA